MIINKLKRVTTQNILLLIVYGFVFVFCLFNEAIYSYDTYDYLKAMPYRQLGYVIFVKAFSFIFGSFFNIAIVLFQTLFSLLSVNYFYKKTQSLFDLNLILSLVLIVILLLPFFSPLSIANNICTEGLSYGLYLLFISIGIDILFNQKFKNILYFAIVYVAMIFVRGQFLFSTLIFAAVYFLIYRKTILKKKHCINIIIFICIPIIISLGERTYHKLKDGIFKPTPFSFVNASTIQFYIANASDSLLIKNKNNKAIFNLCIEELDKKGLLLNSNTSTEDAYRFFHTNLPMICNQTVHASGKAYLQAKNPTSNNYKYDVARAYFDIEAACKDITITLISNNFNKWIPLYYKNISFGFYSPVVLFFIIFIMIFSFIKTIFSYQKKYALLFLLSSLVLSNAMLVAFASHSIMRYLFYNYALLFLIFISTIKLFKREL
ncbi:hypothetical protein [Winogradskyella sp. PG-2]|uniref:hypothetical protein n=1 Tax=Winogradskyella sp. PG-2 TaxID=754409 RepID=UPI0005F028A6|nr:hypothetical protein [Winogradskyella sp. PG-2]